MDNRDYRVRIDLNFDPSVRGVALGLYNHCKELLRQAVNPDGPGAIQETGYVSLERCGHRINEPCEEIEREEVP